MNTKKRLCAWLAGAASMLVLASIWHQVIMKGFYGEHHATVLREEPKVLFVILGYLVLAFLMSYLYPLGYKGGSPVTEGLRFGVLVGLLVFLTFNLILYGVFNVTLTGALVDAGWHVVEEGVGGMVTAIVYGACTTSESS